MDKSALRNSYLLMRHGESEANEKGIIVSDPKNGCDRFGLTSHGRSQVLAFVQKLCGKPITKIVCSDFLRTLQTAKIVTEILNLPQAELEKGLRERFFGSKEGMSAKHYQKNLSV
jgi:probable phosphoglycerate mutase